MTCTRETWTPERRAAGRVARAAVARSVRYKATGRIVAAKAQERRGFVRGLLSYRMGDDCAVCVHGSFDLHAHETSLRTTYGAAIGSVSGQDFTRRSKEE